MLVRWWAFPLLLVVSTFLIGVILVAFAAVIVYPTLPSLEVLTDYQPKIPLRVYSAEGALIGEFGEERRAFVAIDNVPEADGRGDPRGRGRALLPAPRRRLHRRRRARRCRISSRAACARARRTITMQVARNFFLTKERTLTRKFNEMLLAFKIEASLTQGRDPPALRQPDLPRPARLRLRGRLADLLRQAAREADARRVRDARRPAQGAVALQPDRQSEARAAAPAVRAAAHARARHDHRRRARRSRAAADRRQARRERFRACTPSTSRRWCGRRSSSATRTRPTRRGIRVYTTVSATHQEAAYQALRRGVHDYDRRHGYRGPEGYAELPGEAERGGARRSAAGRRRQRRPARRRRDRGEPEAREGVSRAAARWSRSPTRACKFAARMLGDKVNANQRIRRGAIIRVQKDDKGRWHIAQLPAVESALVSVDPRDGAIRALVGGFDFNRNQYNHVTQALRQPGLELQAVHLFGGARERLHRRRRSSTTRRSRSMRRRPARSRGSRRTTTASSKGRCGCAPRSSSRRTWSRSASCRRSARSTRRTTSSASASIPKMHPPYLTMALGAGNVTPMQMAQAYSMFANGGYRVPPYFIERIEDNRGNVLAQAKPQTRRRRRRARDRPAQRLHHAQHHARRRAHGHRGARDEARAQRPRRQDRDHQRLHRRLVLRLQPDAGRRSRGSASTSRRRSAATRPAAPRRCRSGWGTWRAR